MSQKLKVKLVVSDFHLGKGVVFSDGSPNILEDFVYDKEFAEFLEFYRSGEYEHAEVELIFNGDILNLLQIDYFGIYSSLFTEKRTLYALEKISAGHRVFFDALKQWVKTEGHTVSYVIGNHDVGMIFKGAQSYFSELVGAPVQFFSQYYLVDGVYIEHGQQHESFARVDLERPFIMRDLPEPVIDLPLGSYYVATYLVDLKQQRPAIDKVRPFGAFVRWSFLHDFFWSLKHALMISVFTLKMFFFKTRLQLKKRTIGQQLKLIFEIDLYPSYEKIAFKILDEMKEVHSVIFGHTHILKYRPYKEGKEYFNEGTWNEVTHLDLSEYGTKTKLSFAFIEYPSPHSRPRVKLKEWKGLWKPEKDL